MTEESAPRGKGEPAYVRIARMLREEIESGQLVAHDPLPPERDLCVTHQVSRMTARRALTVLESEGLVYRDTTRGTFVSEPRVQLRLGSFSHEVSRAGRLPGAELIWARTEPAPASVARALELPLGADTHSLQRLRNSNGEPLALETTYYPAEAMPGLLDGDLTGSLWGEICSRYDITLARTTARLEVIALDATTAKHLQARTASAGILLSRRTFNSEGVCLEYAHDIYRADRVSLILERSIDDA